MSDPNAIVSTMKVNYRLYKCDHERIECPKHEGSFDCNPFCNVCEGNQEYCDKGCEPIACNVCCVYEYFDTPLTQVADDFYMCEDCKDSE